MSMQMFTLDQEVPRRRIDGVTVMTVKDVFFDFRLNNRWIETISKKLDLNKKRYLHSFEEYYLYYKGHKIYSENDLNDLTTIRTSLTTHALISSLAEAKLCREEFNENSYCCLTPEELLNDVYRHFEERIKSLEERLNINGVQYKNVNELCEDLSVESYRKSIRNKFNSNIKNDSFKQYVINCIPHIIN